MATTYKVLGQVCPPAANLVTLYSVPQGNSAVISTLNVCNQNSSSSAFRIAVRPANASITAAHYLAYDTPVPGADSIALTIGVTLAATDVISVYASTANVSFNLFGTEIN